MSNRPAKPSARHVNIYGVDFLIPKGMRRIINKEHPELRSKELSGEDLPKIQKGMKEKRT